jgi:undecaprenyl-diphosphatase
MPMADQPTTPDEAAQPAKPPEQKLGDTPVAPWNMPTPAEKAEAKPVRRALREALAEVDSQEKADQVVSELAAAAAGQKITEVAKNQPTPATSTEAAQQVAQASQAAPTGDTAATVLNETARVITAAQGREQEVVAQATQEVLNPEQQGAPTVAEQAQREYLRRALLKHLKPLDALDANLFLKVNHLPHTRLLNTIFYILTFIFTGGGAWYLVMGLGSLRKRRLDGQMVRECLLPLIIATTLVEHPIKWLFRRRRPFITIIQAIVIGKKPSSWSFPSGHSATAFAGAWLLSHRWPRQRGLLYTIASLVAFSRVYLGDHYPGDVATGSLLGTLFAMLFRWLLWTRRAQ